MTWVIYLIMAQSQEHNEIVSRKNYSSAFSLLLSADLLEMSFLQIIVSLTHVLPASWERKGRENRGSECCSVRETRVNRLKHGCTACLQFWRRGKTVYSLRHNCYSGELEA